MNKLDKWNKAIQSAKSLVSITKEHQMQIAKIALEVCEITHGGGVRLDSQKDKFTIKRFAEEAGLNPRTLSGWIGARRLVYEKLSEEQKRKAKYTDIVWVSRLVNKRTTVLKVRNKFEEHLSIDSYEIKIIRYMCDLRSLCYNFQKQSAAFKCSDNTLKEILFYCSKIKIAIKRDRPNIVPIKTGVTYRVRASAANAVIGKRIKKTNSKLTESQC